MQRRRTDAGSPLDAIAAASRAGKMMLIDRETPPLVTSHVDNVAHAIALALRHTDTDGQAYFVFDADTTTTGEFLSRLLATRGLPAPNRSIPYPIARTVASTSEAAWRAAMHRPTTDLPAARRTQRATVPRQ